MHSPSISSIKTVLKTFFLLHFLDKQFLSKTLYYIFSHYISFVYIFLHVSLLYWLEALERNEQPETTIKDWFIRQQTAVHLSLFICKFCSCSNTPWFASNLYAIWKIIVKVWALVKYIYESNSGRDKKRLNYFWDTRYIAQTRSGHDESRNCTMGRSPRACPRSMGVGAAMTGDHGEGRERVCSSALR